MQLDKYYSSEDGRIRFSRDQASAFAKGVAGDFNPIHNVDAKRFCVPGDLLFSLALQRYGLSEKMQVTFSGMVGDDTTLQFPPDAGRTIDILDTEGRRYLSLERDGTASRDAELIEAMTRCYVQFSGQTFPHILVPLMAEHQVMINTERPLVVYESMSIALDHLAFDTPRLSLTSAELDSEGKRGVARLKFSVHAAQACVGHGEKTMLLSGLRPFEQGKIDILVDNYLAEKRSYGGAGTR